MEQLHRQYNHTIDQAKSEKEEVKVELEMCKIDKIRIEEKSQYLREQYD